MPQIAPFAGVRYNLSQISSLSHVVAPPYDVIDPQLQTELYESHPANVIRIILNRTQPGDSQDAKYERAAACLNQWLDGGVLKQDADPAYYIYNQKFEFAAQKFTRRGFMARVRLQKFGEGNIYPHEETHPKAKIDRLKLTKACRINCSPIFGLFPDPTNEVQSMLEAAGNRIEPARAIDHLGIHHSLCPVVDHAVINNVTEILEDKPMFVADGHHRYETACNYRDYLTDKLGPLPNDHPANFVMTQLVSMSDSGLIVLPTHRLLRGTPNFTSDELIARLDTYFRCEKIGEREAAAHDCWDHIELADRQGLIALYATKDSQWVLCEATPAAREKMKVLAPEQSDDWRALGVSLLHRLIIESLLDCADHPKPTYVHQVDEVIDALRGVGALSENDSDEPFTLAALVMPARISDVEAISLHRERMPAKSTYFYPKLLSGMVFHKLT